MTSLGDLMKKYIYILSSFVLFQFGHAAFAGIILFDDFDGDTTNLNGAAADIGGNWVAEVNGDFQTNGVFDGGRGSATLAFTPVDGFIYTAETWMTGITGTNRISFGFVDGQSSGTATSIRFQQNGDPVGRAWMDYIGSGDPIDNFAYNDLTGSAAWTDATLRDQSGGDIGMRIVLDTTAGTGNWTATWYAKSTVGTSFTEVRATETLLDETITSVGYSLYNNTIDGTIESFSVTAVIPEPSSIVLLLVSLAGGLLIFRRR